MVSQHDLPVCATKDPLWIPLSSSSLCLEDIEKILVDSEWPDPNHTVWKLHSIRVVVCITPWTHAKAKRKKRKRETLEVSMPQGWSTVRTDFIQHDQVGEVTNGRFNVEVYSFLGRPPPHVSEMLVNVVDPQVHGRPQRRIPVPDKPNTFRVILDWKKKVIIFWLPLFIARLRESSEKLLLLKWHKL